MHNLKKILAALLALVMILGLMACGSKEEEAPEVTTPTAPAEDGQELTETPIEAVGSVDLIGIDRVTLHYNADGIVVAITDKDNVACYSLLVGSACADAAAQITQETAAPYAETFLLIKQAPNTLVPNETFLQDIATKVQGELADLPVILVSAMEQDGLGYFSAETAQTILAAYLGNPVDVEYSIEEDLVDGYYNATVMTSTDVLEYTVGALYGAVELQTEVDDDDDLEGSDEGTAPEQQPTNSDAAEEVENETEETEPAPEEGLGELIPEEPEEIG